MRRSTRLWWDRLLPWQRLLLVVDLALALGCGWLLTPPPIPRAPAAVDLALPEPPSLPAPAGAGLAPEQGGFVVARSGSRAVADSSGFVERNPFASSRRPPPTRWSPTGSGEEAGTERPDPAERLRRRVRRFRLLATTVVRHHPGESYAMIEADSEVPGPELYRPGDEVGPLRLVAIEPDRVTLEGRGLRVSLSLDPDAGGVE